jgi:hypothetical protein
MKARRNGSVSTRNKLLAKWSPVSKTFSSDSDALLFMHSLPEASVPFCGIILHLLSGSAPTSAGSWCSIGDYRLAPVQFTPGVDQSLLPLIHPSQFPMQRLVPNLFWTSRSAFWTVNHAWPSVSNTTQRMRAPVNVSTSSTQRSLNVDLGDEMSAVLKQ